MTKRTVSTVLADEAQAHEAVDALRSAGFSRESIGVVMSGSTKERLYPGDAEKVEEGTGWGAGLGAIAGGLAALASLPVPGGLFVAGPVGALVTGAATGAVGGGLVGALVGLGVPEEQAEIYEQRVRDGGVALAVETETIDSAREAERILGAAGGPRGRETLVITKPRP